MGEKGGMDTEKLVQFKLNYFVYKICGPNWKLARHLFAQNGLVLILDGTARYVIDGAEYHVGAGQMVFVGPGSTRDAATTGMTCAAFDFELNGESIALPPVSPFLVTEDLLRQLHEFQYEWLQKSPGRDLKCAALFLRILHTLMYSQELTDTNYHVDKMKRYIVEHFAEAFTLQDLAQHVGLSRVYCGALFRKTQGITVAEYLNKIRIHESAAMLSEGAHNITETAYLCGFRDLSYYSHTFKRIMGVSPAKYKGRRFPER